MVEINPVGSPQGVNPVLPMGRIVFGNPMIYQQATDYNTKQPKISKKTGLPVLECTFGFAVPKQGEQHWAETAWGSLIYAEGANAFPAMIQRSDFAWKIVDGDSSIPNKSGVLPNSKEGYPGHWVLTISSSLSAVKCFKANPQFGTTTECVSDKDIKTGDYGRLVISCVDNRDKNTGQSQTPGVYLNPIGFCMDKEGTAIVGEGVPQVNAAAAFGGTVVNAPAHVTTGAPAYQPPAYQPPVQQQTAPAYQPPVQPNNTWTNPPPTVATPPPTVRMVTYNGQTVKADDLLAAGWTEAQIQQHTTPAV